MINLLKKIHSFVYKKKRNKFLIIDTDSYMVTRYGNDYGGFDVYDEALKIKPNVVVYSFGIGEDLSFSEAILNNFTDPQIFAFDPTPKSIDFVRNHELSKRDNFHFFPYGLSEKDGKSKFFLPKNDNYVSGSKEYYSGLKTEAIDVEMRCLNTLFKINKHDHIDLLKIDIEGSEFDVINSLNGCNTVIDQICIEVHDRFFDDGLDKLKSLISLLRKMGYLLISISKRKEELTFVRKASFG